MDKEKGLTQDQDGLLDLPFDLTPHDDIQAAALALGSVAEFDVMLMSEEEAELVLDIRKMALEITHQALSEIYHTNQYGS